MLYFTIALCSIGAAVQGWDQTGSNGANLSFPLEFGIGGAGAHDEWLVGLVNSAPYIASAVLGCWLSDPLNRFFGRRGTIFITALILIAAPLGSAFTHSWEALFACRLLMGAHTSDCTGMYWHVDALQESAWVPKAPPFQYWLPKTHLLLSEAPLP